MLELLVFVGLLLALVPFVLPLVGWVSARATRRRLVALEARRLELERLVELLRDQLSEQAREIQAISARLKALEGAREGVPVAAEPDLTLTSRAATPAPAATRDVNESGGLTPAPVPAFDVVERAAGDADVPTGAPPPFVTDPEPLPAATAAGAADSPAVRRIRDVDEEAEPPQEPAGTPPPFGGVDWERLVGVRLFSAVAGVALVIAAVSFLRYSVEHGWLEPPIRVGIGVAVALALLIGCELKAARRYPATANALDAAAIAILFATIFAAQTRWNLIPPAAAFVLMALVTALAVVLSVRRASLFIAVLGLLGGFTTPALLSTGEDRPVSLFAYLLLLNVGLSWVAYRQRWPVLTGLSLLLTTAYQVVWTVRFLSADTVSTAMGLFLLFPVAAIGALTAAGVPRGSADGRPGDRTFESTALLGAIVPLLFAAYVAFLPEYGARPGLLLGFLTLVDAGLLAVAIARREGLLHAAGATATVVVLAAWMATSYPPGEGRLPAVVAAAGFVILFLAGPPLARRFGAPLAGAGAAATLAAPAVLFVFAALAALEPAAASPLWLFAPLLALWALIAWRAAAEGDGRLYYLAAVMALAAEARWSAEYLTVARLGAAVAIYATFAILSIAAPALARRRARPFAPRWGSGAVLLLGLGILFYLSLGPVSASALWGLALLLAILNAGVFVDAAETGLPGVALAGSVLSWLLLAAWWSDAAAAVGVVPSLAAVTGLSLITLGGQVWTRRHAVAAPAPATAPGVYLGLSGYLFLFLVAANPAWALPPWPLFASLATLTLAASGAAVYGRQPPLHTAAVAAAALVVIAWAGAAHGPNHGASVVVAGAAVSAYALGWRRLAPADMRPVAGRAGAAALFLGEIAILAATTGGHARPVLGIEIAGHLANLTAILWLAWRDDWRRAPVLAVFPAWLAVVQWQVRLDLHTHWPGLLALTLSLYSVFALYPFLLGARGAHRRAPALASVTASVMAFFGLRAAFHAAGWDGAVGLIPLAECAVLALTVRLLAHTEPPATRDSGRLAIVAGAALAFLTVAVPLQLDNHWITVGWALEGAALAWLFRRLPHRGLVYWTAGLFAAVFVRLTANPEVLLYETREVFPLLQWYVYTYGAAAVAMLAAARWLRETGDRLGPGLPRLSTLLPGAAVILLFLLVNIEVADLHSTGPVIAFRFGATVSQDLSYTIAWLGFGLALLATGIVLAARPARIAAVALIAVTTFKCFLYDLGSLEGLYRVASFVGLALSLALVALALQKFVLARRDPAR